MARSEKEARDLTPQQYRWLMEGLSIEPEKSNTQGETRALLVLFYICTLTVL